MEPATAKTLDPRFRGDDELTRDAPAQDAPPVVLVLADIDSGLSGLLALFEDNAALL